MVGSWGGHMPLWTREEPVPYAIKQRHNSTAHDMTQEGVKGSKIDWKRKLERTFFHSRREGHAAVEPS